MDIDDHPDLRDLQLSKREQRKARAEARRRQRRAFGMPPEPSFLRKNRTAVVAVAVLAAVVAAGALFVNEARPGVTETSPSTTGKVPENKPGVDLSQPFLNTPAAGWPDGEVGIVAPAATPVGSYTPEQVAAGYERVRQVLVTARLDRSVIEGHDYTRYLELLAPAARTDMSKPSPDASALATRIADGFTLLPAPPKVSGTMWAEQDPDGALLVHTNFVFAYAFTPKDPDEIQAAMDIVVVDRIDADYTITDDRWETPDEGIWPGKVNGYTYSMACAAHKRGELAPSYSEQTMAEEGEDTVNEEEAFDPKSPISTTSTCPA